MASSKKNEIFRIKNKLIANSDNPTAVVSAARTLEQQAEDKAAASRKGAAGRDAGIEPSRRQYQELTRAICESQPEEPSGLKYVRVNKAFDEWLKDHPGSHDPVLTTRRTWFRSACPPEQQPPDRGRWPTTTG